MRISDWSSDVCSSDLVKNFAGRRILRRRVVGGGWLRRRADGWFFRARSSVAPGAQSSARIAALWCWQSRVTASPLRSLVPAPRCNWDVALRRCLSDEGDGDEKGRKSGVEGKGGAVRV